MAAEAGKKKGKTIVIVLVVLMVVLLGAGGFFIYSRVNQTVEDFEVRMDGTAPASTQNADGTEQPPVILQQNVCLNNSIFIDAKNPYLANLKSEPNGQKYVAQVQLTFEVCQDKDLEEEFNRITPVIESEMLLLLREKTAQDLNGREGSELFIQQALEVVRQAMPKQFRNGIRSVLLKKFVVSSTN